MFLGGSGGEPAPSPPKPSPAPKAQEDDDKDNIPEVNGPTLCEITGELCQVLDDGSIKSEIQGVKVLVKEDLDQKYQYVLELYSDGNKLLMQRVDGDMNMLFSHKERSMQWFAAGTLRRVIADGSITDFSDTFSELLWQAVNHDAFKKVITKKEDQDFYKKSNFIDYAMEDCSEDEDASEEDDRQLLFDKREYRYEGEHSRPDFFQNHEPLSQKSLVNLNVGTALDFSFVTKNSDIAVMKTSENNRIINVISDQIKLNGEEFSPEQTMLFGNDRSMMMIHPLDNHKGTLLQMNLDRGEIVQEWQPGDGQKIRRFAPATKFGSLNDEKTFVVTSNNMVGRMDTRVNPKQGAVAKHVYAKSMGFSAIATNGAGNVVVGNDKGEIRLFTNPGDSRAKSSIPGLGDEIIGIDVTEDGHWVLATTPRYLMLVQTWNGDDGKTGFQKSCKPQPIKLALKHEDVLRYGITKLRFTPAHFNVGHFKETLIATSTGPFIVMWDIAKVIKKKDRFAYTIKRAPESCSQVAEGPLFQYNHSERLVVNTGEEVYQEKVGKN